MGDGASIARGTTDGSQRALVSGIEWRALARWMDEQGLASGEITDIRPVGGGTQNIMAAFARGGHTYVIRRGPLHLRPRTNDALRREVQVLAALATTDVPHPRLVAACLDPSVLGGAVFYLMQPIDGFNASIELPSLHAASVAVRHEMAFSVVDGLAALGRVEHRAAGLQGLGRPDGFLERQVPRWLGELDAYEQLEGYPGCDLPGVDEIATWLEERRPVRWTPGIMHGDFHVANVMFDRHGPRIAAVVDWEMCTIGDPLLDLGWLLATWPGGGDAADAISGALGQAGGLPGPEMLLERYAARSSRDLSQIDWYVILAAFKLGILLEGTYARACAGKAPVATGRTLHAIAHALFGRAMRRVDAA